MNENADYLEVLSLIEKGLYEEASLQIRDFRRRLDGGLDKIEEERHLHVLAILLSARIALKGGRLPDHILSIDPEGLTLPFLKGEVYFVRGLYYGNQAKMPEASSYFEKAAEAFSATSNKDRFLLSRYNHLICLSYVPEINNHSLVLGFRQLEALAQENNNQKILGLVLRQKSYFFKEAGRLLAAKLDAERSATLLEFYGSQSDFHLALLNLSEIQWNLGESEAAGAACERVLPPLDPRVLFPLNFIQHLIFNRPLDRTALSVSCPHFRERYELWQSQAAKAETSADLGDSAVARGPSEKTTAKESPARRPREKTVGVTASSAIVGSKAAKGSIAPKAIGSQGGSLEPIHSRTTGRDSMKVVETLRRESFWHWDTGKNQLQVGTSEFAFKVGSLEHRLVASLAQGPISKALLSERLWPSFSNLRLLDNRLHRLISRVNKKIGGVISCRAGQYSLE